LGGVGVEKAKVAAPPSTVPQVRGRSVAANLGRTDAPTTSTPFWQKRYYDHNIRTYEKFVEKLRYIHRNPVKRGLVDKPEDWARSSFLHYATGQSGVVEIESDWTARRRAAVVLDPP
jgi:putative transposase